MERNNNTFDDFFDNNTIDRLLDKLLDRVFKKYEDAENN